MLVLHHTGSLATAAATTAETRVYFSPAPDIPEKVQIDRDYVQWRVGSQLFDGLSRLPDAPYPLLVGTLGQIEELNSTRSTPVEIYGPVRGRTAIVPKPLLVPLDAKGSVVITNDYHGEEDVTLLLGLFETNFPALAKRIQIGSTIWGRPIWALKISDNVEIDEPEPRVVIDANIHANEEAGPEVALDIIWQLLYGYTNNATFASWVNGMEIYVIPCLNPDGRHFYDAGDEYWRKNGRDNNRDGSMTYPTDGVDLNRNSSFDWGYNNLGSSPTNSTSSYRGPSPASEPEIQAYDALLQRVRPGYTLSIHSSLGCFYGPYGDYSVAPPKPDPFPPLGTNVARVCTDEYGSAYTFVSGSNFPYTVNGDRVDANYGLYGIFALGVEVGSGDQKIDYSVTRDELVPGLRLGWQKLLSAAYTNWPKLRGWSTDPLTGAPAPVRIHSLNFTTRPNDEHWTSRNDGFFECPLPTAGTYRIVFAPLGQPTLATTQTIVVGSTSKSTNLTFGVAPIMNAIGTDGVLSWSNQNENGTLLLEQAWQMAGPWVPLLAVAGTGRVGQVSLPTNSASYLRVVTAPRRFYPQTNMIQTNMVWIPSGTCQMGDGTIEHHRTAFALADFADDGKW